MDAVRLHVECDGAGPPLVLAHGFAGSARNWRPQVRSLARTHRVCRFDARGHARSEAPEDPAAYSVETAVGDFDTAARAAGDGLVVAGGLSMGAAVALAWAARTPERTRGLILASLPPGAASGTGVAAVAEDFAAAVLRDGVEAAGARFVWGSASGLDPAAARLVRQGFLEHPPHGLAATLRGVIAHLPDPVPLVARLAGAGVPILLLAGDRDRLAVETSRRAATAAPSARLEIVAGAGHVVNLERAAEVTAILGAWLATVSG